MQKPNFDQIRMRLKRYCPVCLPICLGFALLSLILTLIASASPAAAAAINHYYGGTIRMLMTYLTLWIPFSAAEFLLLFSPVLLAVLIGLAVRYAKRGLTAGIRYLCVLFSVILVLYTLFVASLGLGFHVPELSERLGLTESPVSAEELYQTMLWTIEEANALCSEVDFRFGGASVMPFDTYHDMCRDLMIGYQRLHEEHPVFLSFRSHIKPVILSEPMSYTHLTGIYTFFTGESNLNINFPDYTLPFTAAHELAHQRGFAREKEANFIAFLVCINSENVYNRYSGYVNMMEYLSNALYSADRDLWNDAMQHADLRIRYEMEAYNRFYEKYRESKAAEVTGSINDSYLKSQGQEAGTKSYGLVVDLAVSYYKELDPKEASAD